MNRWFGCLAALVLGACAHRGGSAAPSPLRMSTNPEVSWASGGPHDLAVMLVNAGSHTHIELPEPSPAQVDVTIFDLAGQVAICRKRAERVGNEEAHVDLAPREHRAIVVRLDDCRLPAGEYRYEASYVVPVTEDAGWSGRIGPERGRIVVQRSASEIERSARGSAVRRDDAEVTGPPAPVNPHLRPVQPPLEPGSLACLERELARRGTSGLGHPAGTTGRTRRIGPPTLASEVERWRMLLQQYPDLATLCRTAPVG